MERDRPEATGSTIKCRPEEEEKAEKKRSERTVVKMTDYVFCGVQKSKQMWRM